MKTTILRFFSVAPRMSTRSGAHRQRAFARKHVLPLFLVMLPVLTALSVRAQSTYEPYTFSTFAGLPPGSADGTGSAARFNNPSGVVLDSAGNTYVADTVNSTIRKITPAVTTFAGLAGSPGSANGTGSAARFNGPVAVAIDGIGNIFVADTNNHTIRKITPARVVSTFAGLAGSDGSTNGTGSIARFSLPNALAVDSANNIYVADTGNHTIRKITPARVVSTFAVWLAAPAALMEPAVPHDLTSLPVWLWTA